MFSDYVNPRYKKVVMKQMKYVLFGISMLTSLMLYAQVEITGQVIDAQSLEPLAGATVVSSDKKGAVTNALGAYTISVASEASLTFNFTGYESQTVKVEGRKVIDVTLSIDAKEMETVVIVGAAIKKKDLTGAVGRISGEKLEEVPVVSVNQTLQGRMAGVYVQSSSAPGGNATIKIRGNNSIQYGTDPIYVVDGVVMSEDFNMLNPSDIASIDVLKDASSTAIYGSRGSQGVVVITTKKGRVKGEGKISYDGYVGFSDLARNFTMMNAQQLYDMRLDAWLNKFDERVWEWFETPITREQYLTELTTPDQYGKTPAFAAYELEAIKSKQSYSWINEVTRPGFQQNHNLSASGGTDKGAYFVTFGYSQQEGIVRNSDYERWSGRINFDQNVKTWLKVGTSTTYVRSGEGLLEGSVFNNALGASPFYAINDKDEYLKWVDVTEIGRYNPMKSLTISGDRIQDRLTSANYLNVNLLDGLNVRATFSLDMRNREEYWYTPIDAGQSIRNSYQGEASQRKDKWLNWQWDVAATYDKVFAEKHRVSGMVTFNASQNDWAYNQLTARGFGSDVFTYKYVNAYLKKEESAMASDFRKSALMGLVQRVSYAYDEKYYATVTIREEASSRFAKGNRWGTFPSVALAWNAAEEGFMQQLGWFDLLKLRTGYGVVGNQNIPEYAIYTLYRMSYSNGSVNYNNDGRMGNPDLRWEQQKQWNVGLDVAMLNNRLTLTADAFYINNTDLIMQQSLSSMTGYKNKIANIGALENKGFELSVAARPVEYGGFVWDVSANISLTRNKITKLYGDVDVIWSLGGATNVEVQRTGNLFLGEPLNTIYAYEFDRIVQASDMEWISEPFGRDNDTRRALPGRVDGLYGRVVQPGDILPKDVNGDGKIDDQDKRVLGATDPKFYGGFTTDMAWKGISLNAVFAYSYGGKRVGGLYEYYMNGSGEGPAHTDMLNRWTPDNTNTSVPRAYRVFGASRYGYSDVALAAQDASYLAMTALTLAYDFPTSLLSKIKMSNLRLYCTGHNLLILTGYKGYEYTNTGSDSYYPTSRMYVFGAKIAF
jgi:TonB-linked SusC/RagA family outer membrane protein